MYRDKCAKLKKQESGMDVEPAATGSQLCSWTRAELPPLWWLLPEKDFPWKPLSNTISNRKGLFQSFIPAHLSLGTFPVAH